MTESGDAEIEVEIDGELVPPALLGVNDGMGYGRFAAPNLDVCQYVIRVKVTALLRQFSGPFAELVDEMRHDDALDETPSALQRMGYPTLSDALAFPELLAEVVSVYLHREILQAYLPFHPSSTFVANSTDGVQVEAEDVTIWGRCFRRPRPIAQSTQ